MPERVDRRLRSLDVGPDGDLIEQFALQGLMDRSTFPVVVWVRGLVLRATMPFSRQIRSNITSAGRSLVNRR